MSATDGAGLIPACWDHRKISDYHAVLIRELADRGAVMTSTVRCRTLLTFTVTLTM